MNCQKDLFSLPNEVTYLNCAYMSPQLKNVEAIGIKSLSRKNSPYAITPDDFFTPTRQLCETFSRLIHNPEPERIAIIPSVSYGMAIVAANLTLRTNDTIVVVEEQFPSNYYIWEKITAKTNVKLITVKAGSDNRGATLNENLLEQITPQTRLVSISHVHWADGTKFDLVKLRKKTKEVGALLVIDGTQSIGALPFDITEIQPDALICSGYKWLLGPYSIGMAYFGPIFDDGIPIEENWINRQNSENFAGLVNYRSEYQPKARRYAVGEHSNFILVPMLDAAINQLLTWEPENIQRYCHEISAGPIGKLNQLGLVIEDEAFRASHLFGLRLPAHVNIQKLGEKLKEEQIFISIRGNAIRVAPNVYNDEQDMNKLVYCIESVLP